MYNLDDVSSFSGFDTQNMLSHIDGLPDQLRHAWAVGQQLELPTWEGIERVLVTGMGGSAIGADMLAALIEPESRVPVIVHRNYGTPAWAAGPQTLVIASSHSGNTEETLSAFEGALANGCRCLAVCTGGKLAQEASHSNTPLWVFEHRGQPRAAVGFSFGLLLAALTRLGLITGFGDQIEGAVETMRRQQEDIGAEVPTVQNPAKRLAGQMVGRWVTVIGADVLAPVARRWKGQVSEIAKTWAQFEYLPELDHNTLAGILNPEELLAKTIVLFLRAPSDHQRNQLRSDLTRKTFMLEGLGTDTVEACGVTRLAHQWTCLHFGDYVAYYLAMIYGVDPTPVRVIETFKREMQVADN